MDVLKRVHVVPVGYEFDRIVEPIRKQRADLVYLLEHDPTVGNDTDSGRTVDTNSGQTADTNSGQTADTNSGRTANADADAASSLTATYHEELRVELDAIVPAVNVVACDLTDVYDVLGVVTTIAADHADDSVSVNASGAGTIPAIGATIACMDVSTDATAYYVEPEEYAHDGRTEPASFGVEETQRIPTYPIDSPTPDQVAIMAFLADPAAWEGYHEDRTAAPKKKDLIAFAREQELSFMTDRRSPPDRASEDKGAFRVLDTHVLDPLEADGYVTIESVGRRRVVELTDQGRQAYRAFSHKLDETPLEFDVDLRTQQTGSRSH